MTTKIILAPSTAGLLASAVLFAALCGCVPYGTSQRSGYQGGPMLQGQATIVLQDDYDYFPGYETYYSRTRHEYVYRDGGAWVRRAEPRGITAAVLLASPSVRLDFHDSPAQHHADVVKSYPKNWKQPGNANDGKKAGRNEKTNDRNNRDKKDGEQRN